MKKLFYSGLFILLVTGTSTKAQTTWSIDEMHSKITFSVNHMVIADVDGKISKYTATITTSKPDDFSDADIALTMDVNSLSTDNDMRDTHLKGADFFDAAKFPSIVFKGKGMKKVSDKMWKMTGDLTLKDVTKKIELDVVYNGMAKDPWGNTKAGFKITGKIDRFEYGMKWNNVTEAGNMMVGKEVTFMANVELVKGK